MVDAHAIVAALEGAGYRLTATRALAGLIAGRRATSPPMTSSPSRGARRLGLGRATIFRSLDVLAELGLVERLDLPSGEHAFVACEPAHHHHVVCSSLRAVDRRSSTTGLESGCRGDRAETGYRVDAHRLELFGLCPACQPREIAG